MATTFDGRDGVYQKHAAGGFKMDSKPRALNSSFHFLFHCPTIPLYNPTTIGVSIFFAIIPIFSQYYPNVHFLRGKKDEQEKEKSEVGFPCCKWV